MTGPRIAVLDYGAGNLRSMEKALARAGADAFVTASAVEARDADALVVPGVGNFGQCVHQFRDEGLEGLAREWVDADRPLLGVCVGMQILYESSEEAPDVSGLGLLPGVVRRLPDDLIVPHMGWNTLDPTRDDPLVDGLAGAHAYFVHSYYAMGHDEHVVATCTYGVDIAAIVRVGSVVATQFHPEKSGDVGAAMLTHWVDTVARATGRAGAGA